MKSFMEEYGKIVVAAIVVMIFAVVASPIGNGLRDGVTKVASTLTTNVKESFGGSETVGVIAKDADGNDLHATARVIVGEEKETLLTSLEAASLATADEVDALIDVQSDNFDGLAETTFDVSNIAKEGDQVVILHYDEEAEEWEYITTDTVDADLTVGGDFSSYSPVAFVVIPAGGAGGSEDEEEVLEAGLYDEEGNMTMSWQELLDGGYLIVDNGKLEADTWESGNWGGTASSVLNGKLIIDNSVTTIGSSAFYECMGLTSVIIQNNVTTIKDYAFWSCHGLTSVTIPSSVESIIASAFQECYNISAINYTGTMEQWDSISLSDGWNARCPEITVHCTDGDVVIPSTL